MKVSGNSKLAVSVSLLRVYSPTPKILYTGAKEPEGSQRDPEWPTQGESGGHGKNEEDDQPVNIPAEHADGRVSRLSGTDQVELAVGDVVVIKTPGGGGFGTPD